jgi:hypothetical protein
MKQTDFFRGKNHKKRKMKNFISKISSSIKKFFDTVEQITQKFFLPL